ncbi:MAG: hypothetical protein ACRDG6_11175 [Candidatus Limnocylindria bacterium]
MWRSSFVFIFVFALLASTPAAAHAPGISLSAFGTATIDGALGPGEWDHAATQDFVVSLPDGGTTPGRVYVMNDATQLYLAVRITGRVGRSSAVFEFDNDHDGIREDGDNATVVNVTEDGRPEGAFDDFRQTCFGFPQACGFLDTDAGGTADVVGAATSNDTMSVFEESIPLDSADDAHDFSLHAGDHLGFTVFMQLLGPYPTFAQTQYPACINCASGYGDIVIAHSDITPPLISATVSPAPNGAGWNNTNASLIWTVSDAESGIPSPSCPPETLAAETTGAVRTCTATNGVGLTASQSVTVQIDKSAPVLSYTGNAGTYGVDETIEITCRASDALSGIATSTCPSFSGAAYASGPGDHSLSAAATDNAGNTATLSTSFRVVVSSDGLCRLTHSLVSSDGVATALCQQLAAAQAAASRGNTAEKEGALRGFGNLLRAQSDKTVQPSDAELLRSLTTRL